MINVNKKIHTFLRLVTLSGMLLLLPYLPSYASDVSTKVIAYIQGGQYSETIISRQGVAIHPKLYFGIQIGDVIESQNKKNIIIEVKICSKWENIKLKPFETHIFNKKCPEKFETISNWFSSFIAAPLETIYTSSYGGGNPVVAATRNETSKNEINISLMQSNASLILPGKKSLEIRWAGGLPPFSITLLDKKAKIIDKSSETSDRKWTLPTISFEENTKYKILIRDSNGNKVEKNISVSKLPEKPEWHNELNKLSKADKDLVMAIWLHDYSIDRIWSLEAYNILIGRKDTPALLVMDAILNDEDLNIPW